MTDNAKRATLLLVDDEPLNLDMLANIFRADYRILAAKDGQQALARAAGEPLPDLVLLDVMMPGMDGYEVCRRLKADERTSQIPVIFVTSMGEVGDETRGLELGAVDYIIKPVSPSIVRARVGTHLRLRQTQLALEKEQRRIRNLFGRFVDDKVVDSLLAATDGDELVARNCELTVLFSDAAGFTSYSEGVPTPKLFEDLSRYLTALTQEVLATSGTVDKYIGDALLAYWGAPVALEGAASRAVTTALHIQQRVRSMQDAGDSAGFRTRIGIVTGNVSVGAIGSQLRSDYTVIGDAVNLASRLEGANKSFDTQVLICDKTRLRLDSRFLLRTVGLARVIGHKELIRVHEVLGFGDQPAPPWLLRYEEAYRMLEANDSQSAIEELAQVLVLRNDRVIRALLDRALRARDEPDEVGEHFFDLKWK